MLLYAWKIVCFVVSLSGLLSSWIVLPALSRFFSVSIWVPAVFGVANTVLQVMFCIGLAWHLDPSRMPEAFCIAQSTLIHTAWSCLAGLCGAMSCTTAATSSNSSLLRDRLCLTTTLPFRISLILIFPLIIFGLNIGFTLQLSAAKPEDSLNCDATRPFWIRLLGYAGTSLLLSIPSFVLSCLAATRLMKPQTSYPETRTPPPLHTVYDHSTFTSLPPRRRQRTSVAEYSDHLPIAQFYTEYKYSPYFPPSSLQLPKTLLPERPIPTYSGPRHSRNNLSSDHRTPSQLSTPQSRSHSALSQITARPRSRASTIQIQDRSRHGSYQGPPSPIIFNSPSRATESNHRTVLINVSSSPQDVDADEVETEKDDSSMQIRPYEIDLDDISDTVSGPLRWAKDSDRDSLSKNTYDYAIPEDEEPGLHAFPPHPRIRRSPSGQPPPWMLDDLPPDPYSRIELGRTVAFQSLFSATLILASISTLVDLGLGRSTPTRVGTQHIALMMVTWLPALVLGVSTMWRFLSGGAHL
ncbi:hypothetical protein BDY19DRAFT_150870 [Irpex rosettiformis]|uniref:Uncharacterized protein n=1 Tax=Irpex rosettiformis TaxID=378272 RepID=A0ACB8U420_9APHY|nr:hypothetical protein BDY19DRAFT_150870 [Irpex rosettiformis]